MKPRPFSPSTLRWLPPILVVTAHLFFVPQRADAVTPSSPEVRELVEKAFAYLDRKTDSRLGGTCLIGLAFIKDDKRDHPKVQEALEACRLARQRGLMGQHTEDINYSNGLAVIFLCELDPVAHKELINYYLGAMKRRQKAHGGWGYHDKPTGDTSQTQYGALAYWEAHAKGYTIEPGSVEGMIDWLVKTQDETGGWGYQGKIQEPGKPIKQKGMTPSMASAALGSLLIGADLFGMLRDGGADSPGEPLNPALRVAGEAEQKRAVTLRSPTLDRERMFDAYKAGAGWMNENYRESIGRYNIYYLYALERYKSFEEVLEGVAPDEPEWYQNGYKFLKENQRSDGSWSLGCGEGPDTAFAILFLIRSTQKMLGGLGEGTMVGGRGIPEPGKKVNVVGGRVVIEQTEAAVGDLLGMIDDDAAARLDELAANPTALIVAEVDEKSAQRLMQLVRSGSPPARLLAVRALGRAGDLDYAPTLIYALTDPDRRVVRQARDGLRFISRRFNGFGLPDRFNDKQRYAVIDKWKNWYLSIRPDGVVPLQ